MLLFSFIFFLIAIGLLVLMLAANWKIFTKAGKPGWASIIPIYGAYVMSLIAFGNASYFIACIIVGILSIIAQFAGIVSLAILTGIVSIVLCVLYFVKLSKAFGKGGGFAVGLIFLSIIFLPMLAFGDAEYIGPDKNDIN